MLNCSCHCRVQFHACRKLYKSAVLCSITAHVWTGVPMARMTSNPKACCLEWNQDSVQKYLQNFYSMQKHSYTSHWQTKSKPQNDISVTSYAVEFRVIDVLLLSNSNWFQTDGWKHELEVTEHNGGPEVLSCLCPSKNWVSFDLF